MKIIYEDFGDVLFSWKWFLVPFIWILVPLQYIALFFIGYTPVCFIYSYFSNKRLDIEELENINRNHYRSKIAKICDQFWIKYFIERKE